MSSVRTGCNSRQQVRHQVAPYPQRARHHPLGHSRALPPFNQGKSEQLLGENNKLGSILVIYTKVDIEAGDGSGDLTREAMQKSMDDSLERLHQP